MESKAPLRRQIISTLIINLMSSSFGAANGWASVNFVALQRKDTTFPSGPLSLEQATLVMSIFYVGAIVGNSVFPYIVKKYGSKRTLIAVVFPQIISFMLIIYAQNPYYLYASRMVTGFVGSALMISLTIFVTDISYDNIRGALNSVVDPFLNLGAVFSLLLGRNLDYFDQAKFQLIFPITFLLSFFWVPESPQYLMSVQKEKAANKAHKFFKGTELEKLPVAEAIDSSPEENSKLSWRDFVSRRARKSILTCFFMLCLNIMQGFNILNSYVTEIFTNSSSNISAIDSSVFITSMLIVSSFIFLNVIERAGRRPFYIYSSLAATAGHILFALYLYFLENNHAFDWVPFVAVSYIIFVASMGMNPVPFLVMIEIFPKKIKHYGVTGYISLQLLFLFIFSSIYPPIKAYIGLLGWISFFAVTSLCNALFGIFILPETRGKSYEAIMLLLDK